MNKRKLVLNFLSLLVCLFVFTGCDNKRNEEAKKAKADLAKVSASLEQTQSKLVELREDVNKISQEKENARSELAAAIQAQEQLRSQIIELTGEKNALVSAERTSKTAIDMLKKQIDDANAKLRTLQEENEKLQADLEEFRPRPKSTSAQSETPGDKTEEKSREEIEGKLAEQTEQNSTQETEENTKEDAEEVEEKSEVRPGERQEEEPAGEIIVEPDNEEEG